MPRRGRTEGDGWPVRRIAAVAALLATASIFAFLPILDNGFVNFDDDANYLANGSYRGLGPSQLAWAWTTYRVGAYQPLTWMLQETEYVGWGLDPAGYHAASLALHAAVAVAFYLLTLALLDRARPDWRATRPSEFALLPGLAVALFAVHPLRVEVVAWASGQGYLPCALFGTLAVLAYLRANPEGRPGRSAWLLGSFLLFAAALLSKAVAIGLPAVLLILDAYPLGRLRRGVTARVATEKVPFFALSLLLAGVAAVARHSAHALEGVAESGFLPRLAQSCYGAVFYLRKTLAPIGLTAYYPLPEALDWSEARFLGSIAAAVGLSLGAILLIRRRPAVPAAWAAYLAILAPNLGLVRAGSQLVADRYGYVASMPLFVLVASAFLSIGSGRGPRRAAMNALAAGGIVSVAALTALSWRQCRIWHDSTTLWTHVREHGAAWDVVPITRLGSDLANRGRFEEAAALFERAIRRDPGRAELHNNLGLVLIMQGRPREAAARFEDALRKRPEYPEACNNLGVALSSEGRVRESASRFAEALRLYPGYADAHRNLGMALARLGDYDGAESHLAEAVRINPESADARRALELVRRAALGRAR